MPKFVEMDPTVTLGAQLGEEGGGPVILINTFVVPPEDADKLLEAWASDAGVMKRQPGFISTQLHRGDCWERCVSELRRLAVGRTLSRGVQ